MRSVFNIHPILTWIVLPRFCSPRVCSLWEEPSSSSSSTSTCFFFFFITRLMTYSLQPERCFVSHYHTHLSVPPALGSYGFVQGCFSPILPPFASSCFIQGASPSFCTSIFGCIFLHQGFHWCLYVENVQINMFMDVYHGHDHFPCLLSSLPS